MAAFFFISGIASIAWGFFKMFVYSGVEYGRINVYVGGDAYNIMINSMLSAGFLALGGCLVVAGMIALLINHVDSLQFSSSSNAAPVSPPSGSSAYNTNNTQPIFHSSDESKQDYDGIPRRPGEDDKSYWKRVDKTLNKGGFDPF